MLPSPPSSISVGTVVVIVSFAACMAALLTAITAISLFSPQAIHNKAPISDDTMNIQTMDHHQQLRSSARKVIWLMSFPNSGTSFTIHMTRNVTNCTTATNYALEGEIQDQPSIPAIDGPTGLQGPWLELIPNRTTHLAFTILTKTHCTGFCAGTNCDPEKIIHTPRSFMMGCLTGKQAIVASSSSNGNITLRLVESRYDRSLVYKAIHLFRHPLDNAVARFHLDYDRENKSGNTKYTTQFPRNATGFQRWCEQDDDNKALLKSRVVDQNLKNLLMNNHMPCFNEFYRYVQWHNLAFDTTRAMNIPTMILHYHEYSQDFIRARNRLVDFLDMQVVGGGIEFVSGKIYRNYYTLEQRMAIRDFIREFATAETWEQLKDYNFEITDPEDAEHVAKVAL